MPHSISGDCSIDVVRFHTATVITHLNLDGRHKGHVGGGKFFAEELSPRLLDNSSGE